MLITIQDVRLRAAPGVTAPIVRTLPRNMLMSDCGIALDADGLRWRSVWALGGGGWVAEATASETPLIDVFVDSNWGWSIRFVLWKEGGLSGDRSDPGGLTKFGISQVFHPEIDVAGISMDEAKRIYYAEYWQGSGADKLSWPLCLHHFDFAVNAGTWRASAALAEADGDVGRYVAYRRQFYEDHGAERYRDAWLRRVDDCVKEGTARK